MMMSMCIPGRRKKTTREFAEESIMIHYLGPPMQGRFPKDGTMIPHGIMRRLSIAHQPMNLQAPNVDLLFYIMYDDSDVVCKFQCSSDEEAFISQDAKEV